MEALKRKKRIYPRNIVCTYLWYYYPYVGIKLLLWDPRRSELSLSSPKVLHLLYVMSNDEVIRTSARTRYDPYGAKFVTLEVLSP